METEIIKSYFLQLSRKEQKAGLEALIFVSEEPIQLITLFNLLIKGQPNIKVISNETKELPDIFNKLDSSDDLNNINDIELAVDINYLEELILEINNELLESHRPFQIVHVGGGYQYAVRKEYGEILHLLSKSKSKRRLSHASLEVLAIVAYKQPITKPEIEQIRGVNSGEVVNALLEKNLVEAKGRRDTLGRPLLYGTSNDFLKFFGINGIEDLPKLRELEEFSGFDLSDQPTIEIRIDDNLHANLKEFDELTESEYITISQADKVIQN